MIDAARVFINDAAERVEHEAKRAIAAFHEGDMLTTQMAVLKRFAKRAPVDTIALRRRVAAAVRSEERRVGKRVDRGGRCVVERKKERVRIGRECGRGR